MVVNNVVVGSGVVVGSTVVVVSGDVVGCIVVLVCSGVVVSTVVVVITKHYSFHNLVFCATFKLITIWIVMPTITSMRLCLVPVHIITLLIFFAILDAFQCSTGGKQDYK